MSSTLEIKSRCFCRLTWDRAQLPDTTEQLSLHLSNLVSRRTWIYWHFPRCWWIQPRMTGRGRGKGSTAQLWPDHWRKGGGGIHLLTRTCVWGGYNAQLHLQVVFSTSTGKCYPWTQVWKHESQQCFSSQTHELWARWVGFSEQTQAALLTRNLWTIWCIPMVPVGRVFPNSKYN